MKDKELTQEIEELIKIQEMEKEPKLQDQDADMVPSTQQVTIQSPHPSTEQAPSEEEEIIPLDDGLVTSTYNLSYDELQKNIVQERKKYFPDDLSSPTFIRESVIMTDTRRNLGAIATTNLAFTGATKSNIDYLMVEKKFLQNNLQNARREIEKLRAKLQNATPTQVYLEELKAMILDEVLKLGNTMQSL